MKQKSDNAPKQSRRAFAKAITAALVASPFVPSIVNAQGRKGSSGQISHRPRKFDCEKVDNSRTGGRTHQPPIIIGGGSCKFESEYDLTETVVGRLYVYEIRRPISFGIGVVRVHSEWAEEKDGKYIGYTRYDDLPDNCVLNVWLQRYDGGGVWNAADISGKAHIVIRGGRKATPPIPPTIESDLALGPAILLNKNKHKYRHEHPGLVADKPFRIGKWQIADQRGSTINDYSDENADEYHLAVSFYD